MEQQNKTVFATLNAIDCSAHVEQKNGLTYLSWAWAWGLVKKNYPDATYTIYENAEGLNYHHDKRTAWVKTGVTINGIEHIEMLPVMDNRNRSIQLESITSFDVNKAIQRSLTKAAARHGLGLYIYAGEDLPEDVKEGAEKEKQQKLLKDIEDCNNVTDVLGIWTAHPELHAEGTWFYNAIAAKNRELNKQKEGGAA